MDSIDKRPKRRKSKDNPYTLESIEEKDIYKVSFSNGKGIKYKVDISSEIFDVLNQFELDDLKALNEYDRHIEHLEQNDEALYKKSKQKEKNLEIKILENFIFEELHNKISKLPEVQKRRINMYFFEDMTLQEIASKEKCSKVAIKHSIDDALKNLKKILKNY